MSVFFFYKKEDRDNDGRKGSIVNSSILDGGGSVGCNFSE